MSVGAAAALVALAAGLTATVLGAITLIRGVRGWRQWLAVPVGRLLVWFLAWPLTVALMVTNVPPTRLGTETPADRGIAFEDVTFNDRRRCAVVGVACAISQRRGRGPSPRRDLDPVEHAGRDGRPGPARLRRVGDRCPWPWPQRRHGDGLRLVRRRRFRGRRHVPVPTPRRRRAPHRCRGSLVGRRGSPRRSGADPRIRAVIAEGISGRGTVADDDLNLPNDPRRWMNVAQTWIHCFLQMAQAPRGSFRSSRT